MASTSGRKDYTQDSDSDIKIRREASKNCPVFRSHLPKWLCNWKRSHIESVLHIYYEKYSSGLPEVLEKIPKMKKLSSQQKKYIEVLKNTNFGPNIGLKRSGYNYPQTKNLLDEALQELETNCPVMYPSLSSAKGALIYVRIRDYITVLGEFVNTSYQKARIYAEHAEKEKDNLLKRPFICEETYSKIVSAFAAMCGLRVETVTTDNQTVWEHLRGTNKVVISKPDFRFHCTGEDFTDAHGNLLTVKQVKTKSQYTEEENLKRKQQEESEKRAKRRRHTVSYSSSSTTTPNESDDSVASEKTLPQTENNVKPWIELDVGTHSLGQHAGELLLDLHSYMELHADVQTILTMPGMIIDKTMVYLTLLEISHQHYMKLAGDEQLTSDDKATIYYSAPYDIFDKEDRCILINTFVSLNNIEAILK